MLCAHCGPKHFPKFPAHEIIERTIALVDVSEQERMILSAGYAASTHLIIVLDRIRVIGITQSKGAYREVHEDIDAYLPELSKLYDTWPFMKAR